jgi:hypothetical protein
MVLGIDPFREPTELRLDLMLLQTCRAMLLINALECRSESGDSAESARLSEVIRILVKHGRHRVGLGRTHRD